MSEGVPATPWLRRVWMFLLIVQSLLLVNAVYAIARGIPDTYPNQHTRLAVHASFGICLAVTYLARRPVVQFAAMTLGVCALVWTIALIN